MVFRVEDEMRGRFTELSDGITFPRGRFFGLGAVGSYCLICAILSHRAMGDTKRDGVYRSSLGFI
jgi:hypothetical protein